MSGSPLADSPNVAAGAIFDGFYDRHTEETVALAEMLHAARCHLVQREFHESPLDLAMLAEMGDACCRRFGVEPEALRLALLELDALDSGALEYVLRQLTSSVIILHLTSTERKKNEADHQRQGLQHGDRDGSG